MATSSGLEISKTVRRKILVAILAVLAASSVGIYYYYYLGLRSVSVTEVLVSGGEVFRVRAPNDTSVAFTVPILFWPKDSLLNVNIESVNFTARIVLPSRSGPSYPPDVIALSPPVITIDPRQDTFYPLTIPPGHCLATNVLFTMDNATLARRLSDSSFNYINVYVTANLSSGLQHETIFYNAGIEVWDTPVFVDNSSCTLDHIIHYVIIF